ncbi:hypothetical protein BCR39DRAFT_553892 [Naematelia encephala]|uniref:Uncharacterized protein n=1 Tax=Naematelia encephala TaxID=71784 RepID=A0A1Y2AFJ9_9TREE|nr:hypothetical protein BCR39DRAFT_553892 [Naematelia encephala]
MQGKTPKALNLIQVFICCDSLTIAERTTHLDDSVYSSQYGYCLVVNNAEALLTPCLSPSCIPFPPRTDILTHRVPLRHT